MGKTSKERVERILGGKETAIRGGGSGDVRKLNVSERVVCRIEDATRKVIEKTIVPKWSGMTLPQQVKVARGLLRVAGVANFRSDFLKPGSFPDDIKERVKAGWTNDQIITYFLGCPEFLAFWGDIELTEDNFRTLLPDAADKARLDAENFPEMDRVDNTPTASDKRPWYRRMLFGIFSK